MENTDRQPAPPGDTFRFFWIREHAPRRVEVDAGLCIERPDLLLAVLGVHPAQRRSLGRTAVGRDHVMSVLSGRAPAAGLPRWVASRLFAFLGPLRGSPRSPEAQARVRDVLEITERLRACAADVSGEVEVHLPFIDRRHWRSRSSILRTADYKLAHSRIAPRSLMSGADREAAYIGRLIAASSVHGQGGAELRYRITGPTWSPLADVLLPMAGPSQPPPPGAAIAEIELALSADACRAWTVAPRESDHGYFAVHAQVSVALQSALRRWTAFLWLTDLDRCRNIHGTRSMLVYRSGSVHSGSRSIELTYDTLSTDWLRPFFRHARKPLANLLRSIREELLRVGKDKLAEFYYPAHKRDILEQMRRQRRLLHDLVTAEGAIVNEILRLGVHLREADPKEAVRAGARCAQRLRRHLRHMSPDCDYQALAPVLLFEATNALHVALGGESGLRSSVSLRSAGESVLAACA